MDITSPKLGDYETVDVATMLQDTKQAMARIDPAERFAAPAHRPANPVRSPVQAASVAEWARSFATTATQAFVQDMLGVPDGRSLSTTEDLIRALRSTPPTPGPPTVRDRCLDARDAAVGEAVARRMEQFRTTIDDVQRTHASERGDIDRSVELWGTRIHDIVEGRRANVERVIGELQSKWDSVVGSADGSAAVNADANLSDRMRRYMMASAPPGSLVGGGTAAATLAAERLELLDSEVRTLMDKSFLQDHEKAELLSLLRRRTDAIDAEAETIGAIRTSGGASGASGASGALMGGGDLIDGLRTARKLEAERSTVNAVEWRLNDAVRTLADACRARQTALFRSNLDDARQRTLAGLDEDIASISRTTDAHLARLDEHRQYEPLPHTAHLTPSREAIAERLAQVL